MPERSVETRLAQAGLRHGEATGAISVPIYQTATFRHPRLGESTGFDYSRSGNPTRSMLEATIADLEGGCRGFAFASGMAAITSLLLLLDPGDHIVVSEDLYGGTYRLLEQIFSGFGLRASYVDTTDLVAVRQAIKPETRMLFVETPSNPLIRISDLEALGRLARQHRLLAVSDNTFMTPYLQRPLSFGWDVVIHSATKFLSGHNDVVAGLLATRLPEMAERVAFVQNAAGAILGPQDCWLVLRGLKTLAVRLDRAQANAAHIAEWLGSHPKVAKVYYPGLSGHAGRSLHLCQASGAGAMISFEVQDQATVASALERVEIVSFAESLGGVESLLTYPARQTHADVPAEMRERLGVNDRLLRLSVGIEAAEDLIGDLAAALG